MTAIEFENVGKLYRLGLVGTGTISHDLNRWWQTKVLRHEDPYLRIGETNDRSSKGDSQFVWALKDIDFKVEQGDVVGIIGKNGAGKSTLLKLLSRVTAPTVGTIRARGRIASLLEVGTGFHPELTGRENVYMNGSIMGMRRAEITRKLDEIVDFAGVERYIDTPVKRYSSGMRVRLGFAVAAFLEPEILVVDEVLAVGDAEFQKKAIGKMQDVATGQGRTVLFVSHNMAAVRQLCHRGILLENGKVVFDGGVTETIDHYLDAEDINNETRIIDHITNKSPFIEIDNITIDGNESCKVTVKPEQDYMEFIIDGYVPDDSKFDVSFVIKTKTNVPIVCYRRYSATGEFGFFKKGKFKIRERVALPSILHSGSYNLSIIIHNPNVEIFMKAEDCAEITFMGRNLGYDRIIPASAGGFLGLERYGG